MADSTLRLSNNAIGYLLADITDTQTSITLLSGNGAKFPSLSAGQWFPITLISGASLEIMQVTARSGDVLTVVRAQEGTAGSAFSAGARAELRLTAGTFVGELERIDNALGSVVADAIPSSEKGAANGVAPLGADSKLASTYLPSYVDDVVEVANYAALPGTGEAGKIYTTLDNNKIYRWSGSAYVEISPSPGSTDSVTEGSSNLYFTYARVRDTVLTGLSTATNAVIAATDTILVALGKLQKQISDLTTTVSGKQAALVSGDNIKTVGGVSMLGSGDVPISITTDTVLSAAAGATIGAIGTYAMLAHATANTAITEGGTYAGSALRYYGVGSRFDESGTTAVGGSEGTAPSGTWLAMGTLTFTSSLGRNATTLFLRIS